MKNYVSLFVLTALVACQSENKQKGSVEKTGEKPSPPHSSTISHVFNAHGGLRKWNAMRQLNYDLSTGEHHLIELRGRKVRIDAATHTIGFDGRDVWFTPADAPVSNPRFYHNLYFYFIAMPFVFGDPGITYEDMEEKALLGKTYKRVKISYHDGVGDSPKDNYIIYFDPSTHKMEWLMYTVTFGKGAESKKYNLIKYEDWKETNGLSLANKLTWYVYENEEAGEAKNTTVFSNLTLSTEMPAHEKFAMPEGAAISGMPDAVAK